MQERVRNDVTRILMTVRVQAAEEAQQAEEQAPRAFSNVQYSHADFAQAAAGADSSDTEAIALALQQGPASEDRAASQPIRRFGQKIGRNDPCPCGSGKKFKQCHGRLG